MTALELRAVLSLAAIYGIRMLGLFLILPVFAIYAKQLPDYTPLMAGLAIGAYALTQALLQIPLGLLSDRIGRKPIIIGGLLIFAIGGAISALSNTLYGIIIGRTIQGCGAISGSIVALTVDLIKEEALMQAMAIIHISIGVAFMSAFIVAPILEYWVGMSGIFWITSLLAISGIAMITLLVPQPTHSTHTQHNINTISTQFIAVLGKFDLLQTYLGIFTLQLLMTSLFLVVPIKLRAFGIPTAHHWHIYAPVLFGSVIGLLPLIFISKHGGNMKTLVLSGIVTLIVSELALYTWGNNIFNLSLALFLYFTAFNLLESALPSLTAKFTPAFAKGTAMGIFSSAQFLGAFCGGLIGGLAHQTLGLNAVFLLDSSIALLWFIISLNMTNPPRLTNKLLPQ